MTSWSKSQFKRLRAQISPRPVGGEDSKARKIILTDAEQEEIEQELKEYLNGINAGRTKTKTGGTS